MWGLLLLANGLLAVGAIVSDEERRVRYRLATRAWRVWDSELTPEQRAAVTPEQMQADLPPGWHWSEPRIEGGISVPTPPWLREGYYRRPIRHPPPSSWGEPPSQPWGDEYIYVYAVLAPEEHAAYSRGWADYRASLTWTSTADLDAGAGRSITGGGMSAHDLKDAGWTPVERRDVPSVWVHFLMEFPVVGHVDVDRAEYFGDEMDGVYVEVGEALDGWYVSAMYDLDSVGAVDGLFNDDGPHETRKDAVRAGWDAALDLLRGADYGEASDAAWDQGIEAGLIEIGP